MATLNDLVARVALELRDAAHITWTADELAAHVARALRAYERVNPRRCVTTLTPEAGSRELSLAGIAGLMQVLDVWYPYDPAAPRWPPERPPWTRLSDDVLRLEVPHVPDGSATAQVRLFYSAPQLLEGLDGAETTTLDAQGEALVVLGATAYAGEQVQQSVIGQVTVSGWTPRQWEAWAAGRLRAFEAGLEGLRRRAIMAQDARATWQALTRAEGRGGVV